MEKCTAPVNCHRTASAAANCPACSNRYNGYGSCPTCSSSYSSLGSYGGGIIISSSHIGAQ